MSSPNNPSTDPLDNFIGRSLKNWLWDKEPPLDSKEKLLQTVYEYSQERVEKVKWWHLLSHNLLGLSGRISSALDSHLVPSSSFIDLSFTDISMQRSTSTRETIFRSFPTRMEYFCLIN
jgi:hypothetical protein